MARSGPPPVRSAGYRQAVGHGWRKFHEAPPSSAMATRWSFPAFLGDGCMEAFPGVASLARLLQTYLILLRRQAAFPSVAGVRWFTGDAGASRRQWKSWRSANGADEIRPPLRKSDSWAPDPRCRWRSNKLANKLQNFRKSATARAADCSTRSPPDPRRTGPSRSDPNRLSTPEWDAKVRRRPE